MKLTSVMLREIVWQISHGNPLWGMLIGNEYLHKGDQLRKALVSRFTERMRRAQGQDQRSQVNELTQQLISGATAAHLSDELMGLVGARLVYRYRYPIIQPHIAYRAKPCKGSLVRPRRAAPTRFHDEP